MVRTALFLQGCFPKHLLVLMVCQLLLIYAYKSEVVSVVCYMICRKFFTDPGAFVRR